MVISKEDALFKTRPKPKVVNSQLRWISLFLNSSWIKTTASGLSYELSVNGEKKWMETLILLTKIDITHFTLLNLKILAVYERWIKLYYDTVTLKLSEDESQCQKRVMVINIFQLISTGHALKLLDYTSRHCFRTLSKKTAQ